MQITSTVSNTGTIDRYCKALVVNRKLISNWDAAFKKFCKSGRHISKFPIKDLEKLVKKLMENNAMQKRNGRKLKCYSDISPSLISDVDLQGLFKWINDHKKLVSAQRKAR